LILCARVFHYEEIKVTPDIYVLPIQTLRGLSLRKNLFDKRYANNALDFGGPVIFQPGDPMTFGIALTARL
jgi:hypothetical protein